jgi:Glycosyltransferase Family 4
MERDKKKILILTIRPLHNGPRMIREFEAFKMEFEITAIGLTKPNQEYVKFIHYNDIVLFHERVLNLVFRKLRYEKLINFFFERFFKIERFLTQTKFDCIITHESCFLPLLTRLKKKLPHIKIVYNAHEYHPLEYENQDKWLKTIGNYRYHLYKKYLHNLDLFVNVCEGIRQKCIEEFKIDSIVVPNAAFYNDITPKLKQFNEGKIKLIYHGTIQKSRKIENMIFILNELGDNYYLDIMAVFYKDDIEYLNELKRLALKNKNINFIKAVEFDEIIPNLNKYDIGFFYLEPTNFNYKMALPNKLFEFIQAKLCLAISPSPEMKIIVDKYKIGVVANDFNLSSMVSKIKQLDIEEINVCKFNCINASKQESAEKYSNIYRYSINNLLKK